MVSLVLNVRKYDFVGRDGHAVKGAQVAYADLTETDGHGVPILLSTVTHEVADQFAELPGIYRLSFSMKVGNRNKAEATLVGGDFVRAVPLQELVGLKRDGSVD